MQIESAARIITEGGAGSDPKFSALLSRLVGGGSGTVGAPPPVEVLREHETPAAAVERLFLEYESQGLELNPTHVPEHMKSRVAEHNRRVRAAKGQPEPTLESERASEAAAGGAPPTAPPVAPPPSSGNNGGMEQRLKDLETFAFDANGRLARIETKLDHVDKEVSQIKWWIVAQIAALFLAVIGTGVAVQQMTVATFQGAAQVAKDAAPAPQPPAVIINNGQPASATK